MATHALSARHFKALWALADEMAKIKSAGVSLQSQPGAPSMAAEAYKPLFIPLHSKFFDEFAVGIKSIEWRSFGPRWNLDTCFPGRAVILSRGYGKHYRLTGTIACVSVIDHRDAPLTIRRLLSDVEQIIAITLRDITAL